MWTLTYGRTDGPPRCIMTLPLSTKVNWLPAMPRYFLKFLPSQFFLQGKKKTVA